MNKARKYLDLIRRELILFSDVQDESLAEDGSKCNRKGGWVRCRVGRKQYGSLPIAPEPPPRRDGKTDNDVRDEFAFDFALSPAERYLALCANELGIDAEAQDETLVEHDKQYHPCGYKEGDSCKFREKLEKKTDGEKEPKGVKCPQSEKDEVIAKYKGTDEWMKAPNGKETKLSEKQWVQVRTPSFMKCFGNWPKEEEVTRIGNWLLNSEPVVALRGDEFGPNGEKLSDKVPRWFDKECGGVVVSPEFGKVKLDREGVMDDLGHKMNRVKACAFAAVPDVIEKGKAFNRASNWKDRGWDSAVIAAPIRIGKDDYICEVVIKDDGDRRGFYLHRVDYIDKFKLSLAMDPNYKKDGDKPISQNIIAELTDECKQHPCCRDVDENGEPKASNICVEDSAAKARERYLEMCQDDFSVRGEAQDAVTVERDNKRTTTSGVAEDETLEEHDDQYHGGHFDPKTMSCGKRDEMEKEDKSDAEVGEADGAEKEGERNSSRVTPEEDAAYADAVNRGDQETALRMIREAAAKAMPNTKVVDKDGLPQVVVHYGTFGRDTSVPEIGREGMHFGTQKAASDRKNTKLSEELKSRWSVGAFPGKNGKWHYVVNKFKPDEYNSEESGSEGWDTPEEAMQVGKESYEDVASNMSLSEVGYRDTQAILNITNPFECRDQGASWVSMVRYAKDLGYDGIKYENLFEDIGSSSYVAFDPRQVKSASIEYDADGNLIPLSKRFNMESVDSRDDAKGKIRKYLMSCQDEWVDSGDGNIAWKSRAKGKRKKPIDRVPKRKIHEIISENVSLIKTVDKKMLPWVAKSVYKLLNGKMTPDDFIDWLMDECDLSEGRAGVIACDQVTKATERIKVEDWKMRGIRFAMWKHKDGEKDPRDYHIAKWDGKSGVRNGKPNGLDGFVFNLDKPPVIDKKTMQRGLPSTLIGCRCYLKGVKA